MSESPTVGTRILFAFIGAIVGGLAGWGAFEQFGTSPDAMMMWALGGAALGAFIGLVAPGLMEVIAHLF